MRIAKWLLMPVMGLAFSGAACVDAGELNIRQRLLEHTAVETLYSADEHTSLFTAASGSAALAAIGDVCGSLGASIMPEGSISRCADAFTAEPAGSEGRSYILKSASPEPIAYKTPAVPPFEELAAPPDGEMKGALEGVDVYQYMYALCEKGNGKALAVISKRAGRFVRLVEASPEEAFRHIVTSIDSKDPWFFACEGETKFIVEKDYGYGTDDKDRFTFRQGRGLEWVDFQRAGDKDKLAGLDSNRGNLELYAGR